MQAVDYIRRLAILGELRRAGRLLHGNPDAYADLIVEIEGILAQMDDLQLDDGRPLTEEGFDA